MTTTETGTRIPVEDESEDDDLNHAIRDYVRTYAVLHGRPMASRHFGVSRHTLWRFLDRGAHGPVPAPRRAGSYGRQPRSRGGGHRAVGRLRSIQKSGDAGDCQPAVAGEQTGLRRAPPAPGTGKLPGVLVRRAADHCERTGPLQ